MRYVEPVFRPPSEADSFILQVTYGCSHNRCSFCGMYRSKRFKTRPFEEIQADILEAARDFPETRRVFLADGDAMVLSPKRLLPILDALHASFLSLDRVSVYTNANGILPKSASELAELSSRGLKMVYLGLESGSQVVLNSIQKGSTAAEMTETVRRAREAGIATSVIALLGVGGRMQSQEHARETARVVSEMSPDYFSALTLTLVPGTELAIAADEGRFELPSPKESLDELFLMVDGIEARRPIVFRTNHASNYVPLAGTLPDDKVRILETIRWAIDNDVLRPEWLRGL